MRATATGWLLGFVLVVVLAIAWDVIGGGAQFMVGVGMGAGVGYMQSRVLRTWINASRLWMWGSIVGLGVPFLLWDLTAAVNVGLPLSLPVSVLLGALLVGSLQWRLLRPHSDRAVWWVPACVVGWGVPAAAIALNDLDVAQGPLAYLLSIGMMFFGGVVLGVVTGKALAWMLQPSAT